MLLRNSHAPALGKISYEKTIQCYRYWCRLCGIALAIRLQSAGFSTKLIEKRDKPGGRAYVYQDAGFTFDAGPTVITDPSCLEELFELSGRKLSDYVDLIPVAPFYQLRWEDGFIFDYANDQNDLDRQISACSPSDVEGYRRFLAYSKEVLEEGYIKLGHVPFPDFRSMVRVAPQLIRLESYRSVYSKVAQYIKDEHLRQAFSFHSLLVGGNPFTTSAIYALIHALERNGASGSLAAAQAHWLTTDLFVYLKISAVKSFLTHLLNRSKQKTTKLSASYAKMETLFQQILSPVMLMLCIPMAHCSKMSL